MDIIFLQALEIDTVIGIYDWERKIKQKVVFDILPYPHGSLSVLQTQLLH